MSHLDEILAFNKSFVEQKAFEPYTATRLPFKKMVILGCMDTRLIELLPKAMNLKNGDAKIIKNAGAMIAHPFGSIMRSIFVAIYELGVDEVYVIGHQECGMSSLNSDVTIQAMLARGIKQETLDMLKYSGIAIKKWLHGFDSVYESVLESVDKIEKHPLLPADVKVHGLIIHPSTGELELIKRG
ncbi:MAG: carbonic anhydrase [Vallitaleaceae bacterium]|jgi:carbonic anhydrase|nr:carbonic anhydrase [Vallitaleaceae bacterium]